MKLPFVCWGNQGSYPSDARKARNRFREVSQRVEARLGKLAFSGRYHRAPERTIEDDYVLVNKVLGTGLSGDVKLAHHKNHPASMQRYAVKTFHLGKIPKKQRQFLESELEVLLSLDHPCCSRLLDVYESETSLHLVMECLEGGELFDKLHKKKRFSEAEAADAAWHMLLALNYIHSHGVCHRDLKLENFMYDSEDGGLLKLIDFGFSNFFQENCETKRTACGTVAYMAPEVVAKDKDYSSHCDMWSAGVIIFALLSGYMPFSAAGDDELSAKIRRGEYNRKSHIWDEISPEAEDFVLSLLQVSPGTRPSAQAALDHPWLQRRHQQNGSVPLIDRQITDALCEFGQISTFRRCCLEMMAWCLSNEDRSKVRHFFMAMDKNHQGTITLDEFQEVFKSQHDVSVCELLKVFQRLDTNQDREIHYSDFLAAMVSSQIGIHDSLLKLCFRRFDSDASGYITRKNLLSVLGETFEGEEVEKLLAEADLLRDGQISYPEFVTYLRGDPLSAGAEIELPKPSGMDGLRSDSKTSACSMSTTCTMESVEPSETDERSNGYASNAPGHERKSRKSKTGCSLLSRLW